MGQDASLETLVIEQKGVCAAGHKKGDKVDPNNPVTLKITRKKA